jgi:hypothetical protein
MYSKVQVCTYCTHVFVSEEQLWMANGGLIKTPENERISTALALLRAQVEE